MNTLNAHKLLAAAACAVALAATTGCASLPEASTMQADSTVAIGKFRLVRNGDDVALGDGIVANRAVLHVDGLDTGESFTADVGPNGEFYWPLEPGRYELAGMDFLVRGQRMNVDSRFRFDVADSGATYVGTVTLETTFENGFYGLSGQIDNYSIVDDCYLDCSNILARLGMPQDSAAVSLARAGDRLVSQKQ